MNENKEPEKIGLAKQISVISETTEEIINRYNSVIEHLKESQEITRTLILDNRLTRNILNQIRGLFNQNFPNHKNDPHIIMINRLLDLLIKDGEDGTKAKEEFFTGTQGLKKNG